MIHARATMLWRGLACVATAIVAGCAMPPIDRFVLEETRGTSSVRIEDARGPLTYAQTQAILANLKKRSPDTSIFDRHLAVEESIAANPLTIGNRVTLLEDGAAAYPEMLAAIRQAKHSVHLETYIYDDDETGRQFAEALAQRARAGVQVRLVYDSFGSKKTPRDFFKPLKEAGAQVLEYNPVDPANLLKRGALVDKRDHRKLLIVDGRVAFLGGINISDVYASDSSPSMRNLPFDKRPWRDTQVRVEGPAVSDFQKEFVSLWEKETKEKLADPALFPKLANAGPLVVRAVEAVGDAPVNPMYVTFVSAISSAEQSVHITMAYFVPDPQLLDALKEAARRGVDVRLVLPSRTDGWVVFHAGRSFYEELLEAGVKIYERKERLLHSKYAVIDGVWSTVGSSNLDWRSLLHNNEINVVVLGPDFAQRVEQLFAKDVANSNVITREDWRRRSPADRLKEAAARVWAHML